MKHIANSIFTNLIGNYIESREENLMTSKEEMALNEIMHWKPERAIIYLKDKYPEHAEKLINLKTMDALPVTIQNEMIETEMERIIDNMIID